MIETSYLIAALAAALLIAAAVGYANFFLRPKLRRLDGTEVQTPAFPETASLLLLVALSLSAAAASLAIYRWIAF